MEMKTGTDETTKDQKPSELKTQHKHATEAVTMIALCEFIDDAGC